MVPATTPIAGGGATSDGRKRAIPSRMLDISKIEIGKRFRGDMGDMPGLRRSIQQLGLLQPIVMTKNNELVAGARRLLAVKGLGWVTIPARVVDIVSIVAGEFAENEMRKDFTPSERVAIAEAVAKEIGNRQGQRTDLELPRNCEAVKGQETADLVAKRAGFGSADTMNRAKAVVAKGVPALVEAMDERKIAISTAAKVAREPIPVQEKVAKAAKTGGRGGARKAMIGEPPKPPKKSKQKELWREERATVKEYAEWVGTMFRGAEQRMSKAGKPFTSATFKVADGNTVSLWKLLAFNESTQAELLRLRDGESLSAQGRLGVDTYQKDGETRLSFTVLADHVLALSQPRERREPRPKQQEQKQRKEPRRSLFDSHDGDGCVDPSLNDSIPF